MINFQLILKYLITNFVIIFFLFIIYNLSFIIPIHAQQACRQVCDDNLQSCQSDDCLNRSPGRDHDNCINDCVQKKDRCVAACGGGTAPSTCYPISPAELVSVDLNQGTNVTFVWNQPPDPDPVNGGCDGKGRNFTVFWGDCPAGTTQYNSSCTQKGKTTIAAGPQRPFTTPGDVGGNKDTIHYWYIHTECNCGTSVDSEKVIFTINPFLCNSKSAEEQAVCHQNNYLLPGGVSQYVPEPNLARDLIGILRDILSTLLFQRPSNSSRMYTQSGSLDKGSTPDTVKPVANNPIENFKDFLGEKSGIYCVTLPDSLHASNANNEAIKECEKNYEQSFFPTVIHPITPGGNITSPTTNTPAAPVNVACQQACFNILAQDQAACESQTGAARDNCNNDAVQKKDRCLIPCG